MIRAVFGRDRVTVTGHAGYAPKGQDIVWEWCNREDEG